MPAKTIALELIEDILEGLLANLANATRGQFPVIALFLDIARLLQYPHKFLQLSTDWYSSLPSRSLTFWLSIASRLSRRRASWNWSSRPSICFKRRSIRKASSN